MKHILLVLLFAGGLLALPMSVEGQIADDDSSGIYLAAQCTTSAGGMPSDYEKYGRDLARTLSLLSPAQQERVFGYLPQSGATPSIPDEEPETPPGPTTPPDPGLDGTPLEISYPSGNSDSYNDVFADAAQAYWKMYAAAHIALTTGEDHDFLHDSEGWWDYGTEITIPGDKSQSELESSLESLADQIESDLESWVSGTGAEYPDPWPPELPDLSDPILGESFDLPDLGP